jgi:hypothetical protein
MMRTRTGLWFLIWCCAGLAACTAGPPNGPNATVTTPSVGRPAPPSSVQAALSRDAFTPYAALGQSDNDGLAPGESNFALAEACMAAAGYPSAGPGAIPIEIRAGGLAFSQPWGDWGYLGTAEAEQYGFRVPPSAGLNALGIDLPVPGNANPPSLPAAEQAAAQKCGTIGQNFFDASQNGALAGIQTLSNDILNDVSQDPAVKKATQVWAACMAKNGYSQPQNLFFQEMQDMYGNSHEVNPAEPISTAANRAQLAAAVTDATCTQSADLAGIYFAVQVSYEQQLVNANQQALTAAVRRYRTAYQKELRQLPALLRTAKAVPVGPARTGKTARAG